MSTFEQSKSIYNQTHFTIVEIDVPVVEGAPNGFGTPISTGLPSNAVRTYKFTTIDAPLNMTESGILRTIKSISETPAKLNIDKGLASRGTGTVTIADSFGKDPNPDGAEVTQEVINQGSFLSKLVSRNELTNKDLRIKNYRVEIDGTVDLENGAQTRHYIIESVNPSKSGDWSFSLKDELSRINIGESVWPLPLEGFLRSDVDNSVTGWAVDANVSYQINDSIRISEEVCKILAVSDIGTGSASITVQARGSSITYTNTLTRTRADEHSAGDEIFVCEVSDNERLDDLIERILIDVGVDASFIPKADWAAEVDEWHPSTRVNTLWLESKSTSDVLKEILTNYMLDLWFDPVAREVKLSAISAWKESVASISEGNEIDFETVNRKRNEGLRSTRALVVYDKPFLTGPNEVTSFSKSSIFKRENLETDDLFGEIKTKNFEFTSVIDKDSADLLVNRWVNRFSNPADYSFKTQERKLDFDVGDIVDISVQSEVGFDGLATSTARAQITSIKPNYTQYGRDYSITALSYEPVFATGSEVVITGNTEDINLYIQYAGAPSAPVEITFVFDGAICGSAGNGIPAIKAGAFPAGSKLIIILANGADLMAKGGDGGDGGGAEFDTESGSFVYFPPTKDGLDGGIVFDAQGVDCDIYFSGATPSANFPSADGYIIAPSGGDGGLDPDTIGLSGGDGGNGGNGRGVGVGGNGNALVIRSETYSGISGDNGTDDRNAGGFGLPGANNNATGGAAGSGVLDNGGTVVFFGDTPQRYINGNGDH